MRTECKACHYHDSEEASIATHFDTFLKGRNRKCNYFLSTATGLMLLQFRGRVLLQIRCDGICLPNGHPITDFWRLLVRIWVKKVHLAGVRVLGIVDKVSTGPLWWLLEQSFFQDRLCWTGHLNPGGSGNYSDLSPFNFRKAGPRSITREILKPVWFP